MLCQAFLDLLRKYPFSKITIQKIAGSCNMNRQTFYYHFDNIYDLMAAAFVRHYERTCPKNRDGSREKALGIFFHWLEDNRAMFRNVCGTAERETVRKGLYPLVSQTLTGERSQGPPSLAELEYQEEFDRHFLVAAVTQYTLEWVDSDFRERPERMASRLCRFMDRLDQAGDEKKILYKKAGPRDRPGQA